LHNTRISIRYAATAATGLRSVEVEVPEALFDWEIHAALLSLLSTCGEDEQIVVVV
jgi:hypothetical protein